MANCWFTHNSWGLAVLARVVRCAISSSFSSMSSVRSLLGSGRHPFCRCRVRSHQATTADPQSIAAAITQSTFFRSPCCRAVCSSDSSRPSDPFRNRSEAFDSLKSSPSSEESKVSATPLTQGKAQARSKGTVQRTHRSRCPNQTTQSHVGLSTNCSADCLGFQHPNRQRHRSKDSR